MNKKGRKKQNGIILIALVITIIVLVILAGVSIALLTGENGILNKATLSKQKTDYANVKEELQLAVLDSMNNTDKNLKRCLEDIKATDIMIKENNITTGKLNGLNFIINKNNKVYVSEHLWIQNRNGDDITITCNHCNTILHVGDYVDYTPLNPNASYNSPSNKTGYEIDQTFIASKYDLKWRILRLDEQTGQILLVATNSICPEGLDYYRLTGGVGLLNGSQELDNICSALYNGEFASKVRSIQLDDINTITKCNPEDFKNQATNPKDYGTIVTYNFDENGYIKYNASNGIHGISNYNKLQYYDGNILKELNKNETKKIESTYYMYYANTLTNNLNDVEVNSKDSTLYKMLFVNEQNTDSKFYYWINTPFVMPNRGYIMWGLFYNNSGKIDSNQIFNSLGEEAKPYNWVLPVVSLKSDISFQVDTSDETNWTIK